MRLQPLKFPVRYVLAACLVSFAARGQAAPPQSDGTIFVDASKPVAAPETGYLHLGGVSSAGHSLQVNSRYLVLDGKPWLPVMGELHYSRLPESAWEDEILKMKAGGVDIVSTYVFWIHHEEVQGKFDWSGRRDLRHFVELCAKHGMYVWVRPGPWDHGEARNGGFPDWVTKLPNTRTNDPAYIHYVDLLFQQIGAQLHGLMFQQGGPVIGAQLENEYGLHGPGAGAEHILKLKQLAIAAGINPPLFSVTGWPSLDFPPQEVIPVSGGYPDGFWYGSTKDLPPSMNYLFNFNRELGDMGATVPSEDPTGKVNLDHDPYFAAEEAGGMAAAYHRRPLLSADDIAALTLTGIGSGINLYGYYMYQGGTNPHGTLSTLQESQATGFPNDLPEYTYDFQAPLGEFGQERESYRKTRLMHLFLNSYGSELAPMPAFAPAARTRDAADTTIPRIAVRSDGSSGFLFVNNYVRQLDMPARPHFQVRVNLAKGTIVLPSKPIDVPANTYFAWPFHLQMGGALLQYSTAQLLTRLDTPAGRLLVLYALPGIAPEFVFDTKGIASIASRGARIERTKDSIRVDGLTPGMNCTLTLSDSNGAKTTLLLLAKVDAEQVSMLGEGKSAHLVYSTSAVLADPTRLRLRSTGATQTLSALPDLALKTGDREVEGLWTRYTFKQPEKRFGLTMNKVEAATPRSKMTMGPYVDWRKASVAQVPPDAAFAQAEQWTLTPKVADLSGVSELLLRIDYLGDVARLSSGGKVLDDNFYNGLPWQVGLMQLGGGTPAAPLTLSILPMPADAPIYLDTRARKAVADHVSGPALVHATLLPEYETVIDVQP